jgi:hypothetical protein
MVVMALVLQHRFRCLVAAVVVRPFKEITVPQTMRVQAETAQQIASREHQSRTRAVAAVALMDDPEAQQQAQAEQEAAVLVQHLEQPHLERSTLAAVAVVLVT